jgi:hypothetical protein
MVMILMMMTVWVCWACVVHAADPRRPSTAGPPPGGAKPAQSPSSTGPLSTTGRSEVKGAVHAGHLTRHFRVFGWTHGKGRHTAWLDEAMIEAWRRWWWW